MENIDVNSHNRWTSQRRILSGNSNHSGNSMPHAHRTVHTTRLRESKRLLLDIFEITVCDWE